MNTNNGLSLWRDTWSPISEFRREFDRLFNDWTTPTERQLGTAATYIPACDVEEIDDHYLVTLEMAGMKKEDIKLEVTEGQLTISGERHLGNNHSREGQVYSERKYGKFQRSFTLPAGIDPDKVEANYQDGILCVVVPKAETIKPRLVKITNGQNSSKFFGKLVTQPKGTKEEVDSSSTRKSVAS